MKDLGRVTFTCLDSSVSDPSQFPAERVMFVLGTAVGIVTCIIQQSSLQKHANWSQMWNICVWNSNVLNRTNPYTNSRSTLTENN